MGPTPEFSYFRRRYKTRRRELTRARDRAPTFIGTGEPDYIRRLWASSTCSHTLSTAGIFPRSRTVVNELPGQVNRLPLPIDAPDSAPRVVWGTTQGAERETQ